MAAVVAGEKYRSGEKGVFAQPAAQLVDKLNQ
jgi:hypothetical protein